MNENESITDADARVPREGWPPPMTAALIIQLILQVGVPLALKLLALYQRDNPNDPTVNDFIALLETGVKPYEAYGIQPPPTIATAGTAAEK